MQEVGYHCLEALLAKTSYLSSAQETLQKRLIPLENISGTQQESLNYLTQNPRFSRKFSQTVKDHCFSTSSAGGLPTLFETPLVSLEIKMDSAQSLSNKLVQNLFRYKNLLVHVARQLKEHYLKVHFPK